MTYTEEIKKVINTQGMQVIEFKNVMKKLSEAFKKLFDAINKFVDEFRQWINKLSEIPPKQRYKECKHLGIENYEYLFCRKQVYKARSNCQ